MTETKEFSILEKYPQGENENDWTIKIDINENKNLSYGRDKDTNPIKVDNTISLIDSMKETFIKNESIDLLNKDYCKNQQKNLRIIKNIDNNKIDVIETNQVYKLFTTVLENKI